MQAYNYIEVKVEDMKRFTNYLYFLQFITVLMIAALILNGCGDSSSNSAKSSTGTSSSCTISGSVTGVRVSGVTVYIYGTKSDRTVTDSNGSYSVSVPAGKYTITPSMLNYTFTPSTTSTVTVSDSDVSSIDFTSATATDTHTITGTISGTGSNSVTVTLSYGSGSVSTTTAAGSYSFTVTDGTYAITPSLSGYSFTHGVEVVTVNGADATVTSITGSIAGDRSSGISYTSGGVYSSSGTAVTRTQCSYSTTAADVNAVKVSYGGDLTLTNCEITKSGNTQLGTEGSGFYGYNSGVIVSSSSSSSSYSSTASTTSLTMTDCSVNTSATGANGVFAFGDNASAALNYLTIITTGDSNSGGIDATYGATISISNSIISTQGGSSAALRSDRYQTNSPTITASNVNGTTSGTGSPAIYCTATITASNCLLSATGSEAACIEGLNSITLNNTSISGIKKWGIIIYQSMSGDSKTGTGSLTMNGGLLTNNFEDGPAFFVCDTDAVINLDGAVINNASNMLLVAGTASGASDYIDNVNSSWGTKGGVVTFSATDQILEGEIIVCDTSSSIDLTLTNSTLKGSINNDNIDCTAEITIGTGSTWTVTGDSYLSSITDNGTLNGPGKVYVAGTLYYSGS